MKGIQHEIEQHNRFSKERILSLKVKMNSPGDGFVHPREMAAERSIPPWGRFTTPKENNADRFRECFSRKHRLFPKG